MTSKNQMNNIFSAVILILIIIFPFPFWTDMIVDRKFDETL